MKKIMLLLCTLFVTNVFANSNHSHHKMEDGNMADRDIVKHILMLNEALHLAFYNYNGQEVYKVSREIVKSISKMKDQGMKQMLMMSKITTLTASTSREKADKIYSKFSSHLTHIIKMFKLGKKYKEYYCPMAKKTWIQNISKSKSVQNPYLPHMKSCGVMK